MPLVYTELHKMAKRYMSRQQPGHTLQTTELIHEAYLRLAGQSDKQWQNRAHFFGVAAQAMRHVLVDYARSRQYAKRGGGAQRVALDEAAIVSSERAEEIVALDEALTALAAFDPRKSQVVEMVVEALTGSRPFSGKSHAELLTAILHQPFHLKGETADIRQLDDVLQRCLAKDPAERYATVAELRTELIPILRHTPPL
jgi:RNA polymerase sigma factor (TIGR02999 family)